MRVFDFTLLSGYEFSGVDVAQGFRARLFAKNNVTAKFIFTELPTIRDMELYGSQKIKRSQIMSAHLFMTGRLDMSLSVKKEALLENEKENYEYDYIDEDGKVICLYNSNDKIVEILCDEDGFVINESLFKNEKKYLVNYYTDGLSYTELYNWDNDSSDGLNPERRIFWNKQGQMVYEQCIYKDKVEYLFKNGEIIDNVAFVERFVKALNLCENDICIMDRAGYLDYIQPLFENKGKSKLVAVLHSDHFYKMYEDEGSLYMNYEYYYWFKYSKIIDCFVVGTEEHKRSLEAFLKEYAKEIDKRLDGIIAPLNYGDIVIFQYPSWIGVNYDESFVNKIKSYRDTKLIIFVQDIQKLMFDSEQAILDMEIKTLNKADLLILPSKKMHRYLKENGLDEKPVIYQTIWDMPSDICFVDHAVTRCFHFAGNYNRFPFLAEYHGKTPIYQYDANKPDRENDDSFCWRGYFEQEKLMHELSKGGFGLVWSDDEYFDRYYSMK